MSAAFEFAGQIYWGSNASIECYLEGLLDEAINLTGPKQEVWVSFLKYDLEGFFPGKVVFLDDIIVDTESREYFTRIFDAATNSLLEKQAFSDYGRQWIESTLIPLRNKVAEFNK